MRLSYQELNIVIMIIMLIVTIADFVKMERVARDILRLVSETVLIMLCTYRLILDIKISQFCGVSITILVLSVIGTIVSAYNLTKDS